MTARSAIHWTPERGDLVWLDFPRAIGHEQAGRRPAVVLSRAPYNARSGLAVVCPVTRRAKGYPFEVPLNANDDVAGVALSDQLRSVDWRARRAEAISRLSAEVIETILAKARTLLE